ncbi:hypothetical protein [Sphingomonas daechungensis]|uniref:hypothetical protein n=1 Tax=Sphingomonas daechungensis TaxID=1176646 RepID=UPI003783953D
MRDGTGWILSFAGGALLWSVASVTSGGREPWDTSEYWVVYMPIACALCAALGFAFPDRPWRWALAVMLAQMPVMWVTQGIGSLWIPGLVMLLVLALPGMLLASLGGVLRRMRSAT